MRLFEVRPPVLITFLTFGILCVVGFLGCGDDDDDNPIAPGPSPSPNPSSTQFAGAFAGTDDGGSITLTIASISLAPVRRSGTVGTHEVTATAVVTPDDGSPANLSGTYDDETNALNLSGGGYTIVGTYDDATSSVDGTYSGPNGPGSFRCAEGALGETYCGVFDSTTDPGTFGRWNIVISGAQVHGVSVMGGNSFTFTGSVTPAMGPLRTITVNDEIGEDVTLTAEGQIDTNQPVQLEGTYAIDNGGVQGDAGNWNGGSCSESWVEPSLSTGPFVGANEGGLMTFTIRSRFRESPYPVHATSTLYPEGGGTIETSGYFNPETDSLALEGSGYSFSGVEELDFEMASRIFGEYTGPAGSGWFVFPGAGPVYCAEYQNQDMTVSGRMNFSVVGTRVIGLVGSTDSNQAPLLEGTVTGTGTTRTISLVAGYVGGVLDVTGTLDTVSNTVTGTWAIQVDSHPVESGTWGGTLCPGPSAAMP